MARPFAIVRLTAILLALPMLLVSMPAEAQQQICVTCTGPDQTYLCSVDVPAGLAAGQPSQLYCIYRLAKEGAHSSCAAARTPAGSCIGEQRAFVYDGPNLANIPGLNKALAATQQAPTGGGSDSEGVAQPATVATGNPDSQTTATLESEAPGVAAAAGDPAAGPVVAKPTRKREPRTMVELTDQAVKQSGVQLKKAAGAVKSAAEETGEIVTGAAEKTGTAVGRAAKGAFECITSLFSRCN